MRQANPDFARAGRGKFVWNKSSLLHTFLWRGEKLCKPKPILIEQEVQLADVSFYQGTIDWSKFTLNGVIIKAGQRNYPDPQFTTNWKNAKAQGVARGTYWFYDSRQEPKYQAALWASLIAADQGELLHCADYEESYGGAYAGPVHFRTFLEEFQRLSKLPDDRIAIYTGYYYWIAHSPTNLTELNWFRKFELWLAWYTADPSIVRIPQPWDNSRLVFWQWTSGGSGYGQGMQSAELDLNWFNGTLEVYNNRFGADTVPPNGGNMNVEGTVISTALNIRSTPDPNSVTNIIGKLYKGDKVYGTQETSTSWIHISSILRLSTGATQLFDGWCSGSSANVSIRVLPDPPAEKKVTRVHAELVAGSTVTLHYNDGSTEIKTA